MSTLATQHYFVRNTQADTKPRTDCYPNCLVVTRQASDHNIYYWQRKTEMFGFELPSVRISRRTVKFISKFNEGACLVKVILVIS